jgi:HK97 family phage major capsid protein
MDPTTTGGIRRARYAEIRSRLEELSTYVRLTGPQEEEARALVTELDGLTREQQAEDLRAAIRSGAVQTEREVLEREQEREQPTRQGLSEVRGRALDRLNTIERQRPTAQRSALDNVARLIESEDEGDAAARYVSVAGDPEYLRAVARIIRAGRAGNHMTALIEMPEPERAAFARAQEYVRAASLTDAAGGYLVPLEIDPAVRLTQSAVGVGNLIRRYATVRQTVSDTLRVVTSAGVTAHWSAEAATMTDDSPTLGEVIVTPGREDCYVPYSWEWAGDVVGGSVVDILGPMMIEAADRNEGTAFLSGDAVNKPEGILTAAVTAAKTVSTATQDTVVLNDIYTLQAALPARWRGDGAVFLGSDVQFNKFRRLASSTEPGAIYGDGLDAATPGRLLGYPAIPVPEMPVAGTTVGAANESVLAFGNLRQGYVIADRLGTTFIPVPVVLDPVTGRPTGQSGLALFKRVGGRLVIPDAVRVLRA